jgi:hypothetical protein
LNSNPQIVPRPAKREEDPIREIEMALNLIRELIDYCENLLGRIERQSLHVGGRNE